MSLTWRVLLVWLVACALPLQGLAAARMQHCAPSHPAVAIVQTVAAPDHAAHADHGQGHGDGHHDSGSHDNAHDTHHAAQDTAPAHGTQPAQDGGTGSCSACAACCAPLALFAQVPGLPVSPPDAHLAQRPPLESVSFFSDGLDRPPRLPRA